MTRMRQATIAVVLILTSIAHVKHANAQTPYADWKHSGSLYVLTTPEGANLPASAVEYRFPLLIRLHKDNFPFDQAKSNGEDIRFATSKGTPLAYQIEEWSAIEGTASIWVRLPEIKGNARQEIKIFWGKPGAISESNGAAVFNIDNRYASVLHLGESLKDELESVAPKNLGSNSAHGIIGKCRSFTSGKGIDCGNNITNYPFGDGPSTSEAWFRADNAGGTVLYWGRYATRLNGKTGDGNEVGISIGSPPRLNWASDGPGGVSAESPLTLGKWTHVAATYENGTSRIYVNGKLEGCRYHRAAMSVVKDIGMSIAGTRRSSYTFAGDIDEVRVSRIARSADWIKLQYENQNLMQSVVGPLVQMGTEFSVSQKTIELLEGKNATIAAKAGGAQKIYWILKKDGAETTVAVDRFSMILPAGRVTADTSMTLQLKAVYPNEIKTVDIPVTIKEDIPEPIVVLKAPTEWNGRDPIEIVPITGNLAAMKAKGAGQLQTAWTITGGAVIKEIVPDKLLLLRSQYTGKITVKATVTNGGADVAATATIMVTEPKKDARVQRVPGKNEKPEDNQFFARNDKNEGTLHYNGTVDQAAATVFLNIYADDKVFKTESQKLNSDMAYAFSVKIKPGLIKYKVEFGMENDGIKKVTHTVNNLVCGDAYVIDGQSNAEATGPNNGPAEDPVTPINTWIRSYGNQHEGSIRGGWGDAVRTQGQRVSNVV